MISDKARKFLDLRKGEEPDYMMRTCDPDGLAYGGFRWPRRGGVTCPDWDAKPECGNGLHGLLRGGGDSSLLSYREADPWYVVAINPREVVDLVGQIKVPRGWVVKCGDRASVAEWFSKRYQGVCYGKATAGDYGTATAGYRGTATAGDLGTATAGYCGTATAGYRGTATVGYCGKATAGDYGTATAGYCGTATAGYRGTATAGDLGTATAGYCGTATAGYRGTATAGYCGTATAGDYGIIRIDWYDSMRMRTVVGYVGEDGIEANVAYKVVDGELVKP